VGVRRHAALGAATVLLVAGCSRTLPAGWVYVTGVTGTAASVVWTGRGVERVECRGADGPTPAAATRARGHGLASARIEGLRPASRYVCRIAGASIRYPRVRFRTAPAGSEPFTFVAVGDTGDGSPEAAALARRIQRSRPAFLIHLGDMAYRKANGGALDARFFRPYRRALARTPLFPTPGNHDLQSGSRYHEVFVDGDKAQYSFDWGAAHFVSVSYADIASGDEAAARWLADDLARAGQRPWRIVFLHMPPFSPGAKRVAAGLRRRLEPLIEAGHVDLLLAGHQHFYARAEPLCEHVPNASVLEVISGGGGKGLDPSATHPNFPRVASVTHHLRVTVSADRLDIRAIDLEGHVIDRVERLRASPPPCHRDGWPAPIEK